MFQPVYCSLSSSCSYIADSCERIYCQWWINVRQCLNQFGIQIIWIGRQSSGWHWWRRWWWRIQRNDCIWMCVCKIQKLFWFEYDLGNFSHLDDLQTQTESDFFSLAVHISGWCELWLSVDREQGQLKILWYASEKTISRGKAKLKRGKKTSRNERNHWSREQKPTETKHRQTIIRT